MFFNKKAPEEVVVPEPTDPVLPCGVEKVETTDGQIWLLDRARVFHAIDGHMISGMVVDPETGRTTLETTVVSMNRVKRHTAMGWRNSDRSLHELMGVSPDSKRR